MREMYGSVGFGVLIRGDEQVYPGWELATRIVERMIPGSGEMARYDMGGGMAMATVTLRLDLDSFDDYMALQAGINREDTLVLRSRYSNARGTTKNEDGDLWEYLDGTTLVSLGAPAYEIGGAVEVVATFRRPFDLATGRAPASVTAAPVMSTTTLDGGVPESTYDGAIDGGTP